MLLKNEKNKQKNNKNSEIKYIEMIYIYNK